MRGGLRSRLIFDSARVAIIAALEDLGWFDPTIYDSPPGLRRHRPLHYITKPVQGDVQIAPNSFAITPEHVIDDELGLGGEVEDTCRCYVDLFAQDAQFGGHFARDVRDILMGKFPSIGRNAPFVDVYDFRQPTPSAFTRVDIESVRVDRAQNIRRDWENHWWMIRFDLVDDYADEFEGATPASDWSGDLYPAWQRIQALDIS